MTEITILFSVDGIQGKETYKVPSCHKGSCAAHFIAFDTFWSEVVITGAGVSDTEVLATEEK